MSNFILNSGADLRGRDNQAGGSEIYICHHGNITSVAIDSNNDYVTGITMSGSTKFYKFLLPRENINFVNASDINIPNASSVYLPTISFNLPGLKTETLKLFDVLVKSSVAVIIKGVNGSYYLAGKDNGLDSTSTSNFTLGLSSGDLSGSVIELTGLERSRIYEIKPELVTSILSSIVAS